MFKVSPIRIPHPVFIIIFLAVSINFCIPASLDYKKITLENTSHTGFISREFFQAVIAVNLTAKELPLKDLRKECKIMAIRDKDYTVLPILIQTYQDIHKPLPGFFTKSDDEETKLATQTPKISANDVLIFRKQFAWFLDSMVLYMEDYTDPKKCVFVFRKIERKLYEKVIRKHPQQSEEN